MNGGAHPAKRIRRLLQLIAAQQKVVPGKEVREWIQLGLNVGAALAAVTMFVLYDCSQRRLERQLAVVNTDLAKLDLQINRIARERGEIELAQLKNKRLQIERTVRRSTLGTGTVQKYDFRFTLTNAGALPLEVSNILLEVYTGKVTQPQTSAFVLNSPREGGPVQWTNLLRRANVAPARWKTGWYILSPDPNAKPRETPGVKGGGGSGNLPAGLSTSDGIVIVTPADTDFVAFLVTVTVDNEGAYFFGVVGSHDTEGDGNRATAAKTTT